MLELQFLDGVKLQIQVFEFVIELEALRREESYFVIAEIENAERLALKESVGTDGTNLEVLRLSTDS